MFYFFHVLNDIEVKLYDDGKNYLPLRSIEDEEVETEDYSSMQQ